MNRTWPIDKPPASIIIPGGYEDNLRLVDDARQHPPDVSTILPITYPYNPLLPTSTPTWKPDLYPLIPLNETVLVRRFHERAGAWGKWIGGKVLGVSSTLRPLGRCRTYFVEYDTMNETHCEEFLPYIGEVWDTKRFEAPDDTVARYHLCRMRLNMVYIPIMTHVTYPRRTTAPSDAIVFYVGQALKTDVRCKEWYVRVMDGPYAGPQLMRSSQVYAFNIDTMRAIVSANPVPRRGEKFYERLLAHGAQCERVELRKELVSVFVENFSDSE